MGRIWWRHHDHAVAHFGQDGRRRNACKLTRRRRRAGHREPHLDTTDRRHHRLATLSHSMAIRRRPMAGRDLSRCIGGMVHDIWQQPFDQQREHQQDPSRQADRGAGQIQGVRTVRLLQTRNGSCHIRRRRRARWTYGHRRQGIRHAELDATDRYHESDRALRTATQTTKRRMANHHWRGLVRDTRLHPRNE